MSQISEPKVPIRYIKVLEGVWSAWRGEVGPDTCLATISRQIDGKWVLELSELGHGLPKPLLAELETARRSLNEGEVVLPEPEL